MGIFAHIVLKIILPIMMFITPPYTLQANETTEKGEEK